MSPTIPWTAGRWSASGSCSLCAAPVVPDGFRDRASYRDFHITGLCQACQDELYFRPSVADARMRYPVRRGVLAAPAVRDGAVVELALLPFSVRRARGAGGVGGAVDAPRGRPARAP